MIAHMGRMEKNMEALYKPMEALYKPVKDFVFTDYFWLDEDTFVVRYGEFIDKDGDKYDILVEWHQDENRWTITAPFEEDIVPLSIDDIVKTDMETFEKWKNE